MNKGKARFELKQVQMWIGNYWTDFSQPSEKQVIATKVNVMWSFIFEAVRLTITHEQY